LKKELSSLHKELIFYKRFIVDWNNKHIQFSHLESEENKIIPMERISANELKIVGNSFYFRTVDEIKVYEYNPD